MRWSSGKTDSRWGWGGRFLEPREVPVTGRGQRQGQRPPPGRRVGSPAQVQEGSRWQSEPRPSIRGAHLQEDRCGVRGRRGAGRTSQEAQGDGLSKKADSRGTRFLPTSSFPNTHPGFPQTSWGGPEAIRQRGQMTYLSKLTPLLGAPHLHTFP